MNARELSSARLAALSAIGVLALAGCGRLTRTATINQVTTTSGAAAAAALQQELARHGLSGAEVSCARNLIVNVGTTTSCSVTGAGNHNTVWFEFSSSHGGLNVASVRTAP